MKKYRVQIMASALKNEVVGSFLVDKEQLGMALATVLDVPRWVTAWVGPAGQSSDDAEVYSQELIDRLRAELSEPFVFKFAAGADGRAATISAAGEIVARVGGEMRETPGAVSVYLPGRTEPEVILMYAAPGAVLN